MARQVITRLIDDIDGSDASETVSFAMDGVNFQIDLSDAHAVELRHALAPYMDAGTKASTRLAPSSRGSDKQRNQQIRDWATRQGVKLKSRGRIPTSIVEQWQADNQRLTGVIATAA